MLEPEFGARGNARMKRVVSAAGRSVARGNALAVDAGNVIAARTAIMANAMNDRTFKAHVELARMVPEKAEAFSQAGEALMRHSGRILGETARYAGSEVVAASEVTSALAACRSPAEWSNVQSRITADWFERAVGYFLNVSFAALRSHDAAMAPIRETASANARRLKK